MLTRQTRYVLNGLRNLLQNDDDRLAFSSTYLDCETAIFSLETDEYFDYARYRREINVIVDYLVEEKYLSCDLSGKVPIYRLTYKGLHPLQITWLQVRSFLLTSIATPIIVAAATTLVTLWLQGSLRLP